MKKKKYEIDTLAFTSNEYLSKWSKIGDISNGLIRIGIGIALTAVGVAAMANQRLTDEYIHNGYVMTTQKQKETLAKMKEECDKNVIEND